MRTNKIYLQRVARLKKVHEFRHLCMRNQLIRKVERMLVIKVNKLNDSMDQINLLNQCRRRIEKIEQQYAVGLRYDYTRLTELYHRFVHDRKGEIQ